VGGRVAPLEASLGSQGRAGRRYNGIVDKLVRILLLACGAVSVALGVLGMFLPLVPTTPFLLLAAWCFARSSERLHRRLTGNRWFGPILRDYSAGRGVPRRVKAVAVATLWPAIAVACVLAPLWPARALMVAVAAAVTVHILRLPSCTEAARGSRPPGREPRYSEE